MSIGIGETLREARQQAGVRLADAAAETRIRQAHLLALEEEDFAPIGGDIYVKGFIRSYARHLGVDPEPLVHAYQENYEADEDGVWIATGEPVESIPPPRRPITTIVVVLAVLMIGGLALLGLLVPDDVEERSEVAAPDPVGGDAEGLADEGEDDGATEPGPDSEGSNDDEEDVEGGDDADAEDDTPDIREEIVLTLSVPDGRSWASITVDGQEVEAANLESGYSETYIGDEIIIRVGDAASVSLEVNGEDLGQIGGSGAVVDVRCSTAAGACEIG